MGEGEETLLQRMGGNGPRIAKRNAGLECEGSPFGENRVPRERDWEEARAVKGRGLKVYL